MFAASAVEPQARPIRSWASAILERRGAETAALPGNGEPEIPRLVHLAEVLEREAAVAVDAFGAGGERPGQRIGEGDQLRLALGPGEGIVHKDQCYRLPLVDMGRSRPTNTVQPFLRRVQVKGRCLMDWKLELVVIPVTDVDRAKRFYSEQVGFVVDHDTRIGDEMRVVQLTPAGSACSIAIGTGLPSSTPGSVQGIQLVVPDIDAARAELLQGGVEVSAVQHFEGSVRVDGRGGDWNSFIFFSDPDGNGWMVQERPASN